MPGNPNFGPNAPASFAGSEESLKPEKPLVVVVGSGGLGVVETLAGAEENPNVVGGLVSVVVVPGAVRKGDLEVAALKPPNAGFGSAGLSVDCCCCCWLNAPNVGVGFSGVGWVD